MNIHHIGTTLFLPCPERLCIEGLRTLSDITAVGQVRHMVEPQATLFRSTHHLPLQSWRSTKAFGD
jgi:hypothetical protein